MNKWVKWLLVWVVGLVVVAAIAVAVFLASFNPNTYKSKLVDFVHAKYARTLAINGDIGLKFFPSLALQLEDVSLSEPGSDKNFASIKMADLSVAILPLLSNHVQINHITVTGLEADIIRDSTGRFNFADLLGSKSDAAKPQASPGGSNSASTENTSSSNLVIDVAGIKLADSEISYLDQKTDMRVNVYKIKAKSDAIALNQPFNVKLESLVNSNQPQMAVHIQSEAQLTFSNNWHNLHAAAIQINASGDLAEFRQAQASLNADLDLSPKLIQISALNLSANGDLATKDPINAVRLQLGDGKITIHNQDKPVTGKLFVSKLAYADEVRDLNLSDIATDFSYDKDSMSLNNIVAVLYGGQLQGQIGQNKNKQINSTLDLNNISMQPLLKAFSGKDLMAGTANGKLVFKTNGANTLTMQQELAGKLSLDISQGYVLGLNSKRSLIQLNELLADFKSFDLSKVTSPFAASEKTGFSDFNLQMDIKNGVGTINKLFLASDLANVTQGKPAQVDIVEKNLNLMLNIKIAENTPEANKVKRLLGFAIPVYITGVWSNPNYTVKLDKLLENKLLDGVLQQGLDKLLGQQGKASQDSAPAKEQAIGKALKNLFSN